MLFRYIIIKRKKNFETTIHVFVFICALTLTPMNLARTDEIDDEAYYHDYCVDQYKSGKKLDEQCKKFCNFSITTGKQTHLCVDVRRIFFAHFLTVQKQHSQFFLY